MSTLEQEIAIEPETEEKDLVVYKWVERVALIVLACLMGFIVSKIDQHENRLTTIEACYVTLQDVGSSQDHLLSAVKELRTWIENRFPTAESQKHLERDINQLRDELYRLRNGT